MSNEDYPPFELGGSRFNQSTFSGRFNHLLDIVDPRVLLTSKASLEKSVALLDDYKNGKIEMSRENNIALWKAQKIKQAIIHPDTNEKIPMPFRMSGYVPFGSPIVVGLLLPNQTIATTIFWQWINQSHNACVNFCNRNASKKSETKDFVYGYMGAVSTAVSIALGLNYIVGKANTMKPTTKLIVQRFIPFPAVACASVCNVLLMRRSELSRGIEVLDYNGNVVGVSKIAASKALKETALTRAVLPAPILILPPIVTSLLEKTKWYRKFPRLHLPIQAFVCTASFGFALPLAIALFPQISTISVGKLEKEIQERVGDRDGLVWYNKGL